MRKHTEVGGAEETRMVECCLGTTCDDKCREIEVQVRKGPQTVQIFFLL